MNYLSSVCFFSPCLGDELLRKFKSSKFSFPREYPFFMSSSTKKKRSVMGFIDCGSN